MFLLRVPRIFARESSSSRHRARRPPAGAHHRPRRRTPGNSSSPSNAASRMRILFASFLSPALEPQPRRSLNSTVSANWPITIDLIRIKLSPHRPFATSMPVSKSPKCIREKRRQHLYRHRRLDLRAVARGVLSGEADAGEGAGLCRLEADLDRDQRHLLRLAEAGELSQMGARGARRLRVLAEGPALRHQPARAGGGRRFREAVL